MHYKCSFIYIYESTFKFLYTLLFANRNEEAVLVLCLIAVWLPQFQGFFLLSFFFFFPLLYLRMYIWHNIKSCAKFRRTELNFQLTSHVNFKYDFFSPKSRTLKYLYKIAVRVLCQSVSTISTFYIHLEQLIHYTQFRLWNHHVLE